MSGVAILGVPSSAGARRSGQELAPEALRGAGLRERLERAGLRTVDLGDLPPVIYRPDPARPRRRNVDLVVGVVRAVAERVARAPLDDHLLLVLGGDCSLSVGVVSGLLARYDRLGLLYFDGDLDLNTPDTTPSGVFEGMVAAHLLGRGEARLADVGPRRPLLAEEDIVFFGYDPDSGWIDPPELEALHEARTSAYPLTRIRRDSAGAARDALRDLLAHGPRPRAFAVHFDVDVMDFPAADVVHSGGLDVDSTVDALRILVAAPSCVALIVTELNPHRDPEGVHTEALLGTIVEVLSERAERPR